MKINAFFVALLIIFCLELTACSRNNSIVGKWENDRISSEFFEDGTYIFRGPYTENGTWRDLGNGKIVVTSGGSSLNGSYVIKNNILNLSFENGDKYILTNVENLRINEPIVNDGDIGNFIPLDNKEAIEEQLGRMLETFDEDSSDEDLFKILMLMSEYKQWSDLEENNENE